MARYKVGDKVRLIDNFEQGRIYYMRGLSNRPGVSVTIKLSLEERMKLAGKIVTIGGYRNDRYQLKEDTMNWLWSDDMFENSKQLTCHSLL